MPTQIPEAETESAGASGPAAERSARTFRLAAAVLAEMRRHGVAPTPRNYELWFTYRSGANPELTQRMAGLLEDGQTLTPMVLDALYGECVAGVEPDLDAIGSGSDAIHAAAQTLIEQVAGGQAALQDYGDALARGAVQLGQDRTHDGLVRGIMALTAETTRAAERNRVLEQQLAASAARIGKLRKSLSDVRQEATKDSLTGLCNRRAFDARIRRMVAQVKAEPGTALSLLLVDVDHFKRFNDTHGHRVGDLVLRLVARLLADNVKGRDTVARYGGEEFAILLAGADLRAVEVVAWQINAALSSKRLVNKETAQGFGHVTASVGAPRSGPATLRRRWSSARTRRCMRPSARGVTGSVLSPLRWRPSPDGLSRRLQVVLISYGKSAAPSARSRQVRAGGKARGAVSTEAGASRRKFARVREGNARPAQHGFPSAPGAVSPGASALIPGLTKTAVATPPSWASATSPCLANSRQAAKVLLQAERRRSALRGRRGAGTDVSPSTRGLITSSGRSRSSGWASSPCASTCRMRARASRTA